MRLVAEIAIVAPTVTTHAVMLDQIPALTGKLGIHSVPVVFLNNQRVDGPINEWVLISRTVRRFFECARGLGYLATSPYSLNRGRNRRAPLCQHRGLGHRLCRLDLGG